VTKQFTTDQSPCLFLKISTNKLKFLICRMSRCYASLETVTRLMSVLTSTTKHFLWHWPSSRSWRTVAVTYFVGHFCGM